MKILVDEVPCSCHVCLFGEELKPDSSKCTLHNREHEDYKVPDDCPLVSINRSLNMIMKFGDDYEGKYCEVKIKLDDKEIAKCRGNIRWSFS